MLMDRLTRGFVNHYRFAFLFLLSFVTLLVCGQSKNSTVSIYIAKGDTMYSDKANEISIVTEKNSRDQFLITSNQGRIRSSYNQKYYVDSLKNGKLIISIFRTENEKKVLLQSKSYTVSTSPQRLAYDRYSKTHGFNLSGYVNRSKIPFSVFKTISRIGLSQGLELAHASFYISGGSEFPNPYYTQLSSPAFPDYLLKVLSRVQPGSSLVFDRIMIRDASGNSIMLPDLIVFEIVAD
jgi:hypothetical protein